MFVRDDHVRQIGSVLNDAKRPLKERFRALFTLRNIGGDQSIQCICDCFKDSSVLLKHELAYCLGQMQDPRAIDALVSVLKDVEQDPIVRHEAAEALGAIGKPDLVEVLEIFKSDAAVEVVETCEIALERLKWLKDSIQSATELSKSLYSSVDPAPPSTLTDINELQKILVNNNASLFERYRAMFSLRNLNSDEAVLVLGSALKCGSSLFRHEIAFVLGQLQNETSVPFLIASLQDSSEHEMVRHECAEALGAISTDECVEVLKKYLLDERRIVRESCEVALDMCEYENSPEFQYANTLCNIAA